MALDLVLLQVKAVQAKHLQFNQTQLELLQKGAGQHVAIGTTGPATTADYYVPSGGSATLSLGRVSSIPAVGIATGQNSVVTLLEGMGNPFKVMMW